jgi:peptide/nickel transport system substrate-binding protein
MEMAIDHQTLIKEALHGFASQLYTDHGSASHPGYQPNPPCPPCDPAAANKLLDDYGWVKGPDGVRSKGGQRLEFEYSTAVSFPPPGRLDGEVIVQRNLQAIGIKLDDFYCNHALDALYQQEPATGDPGVRQQIFYQIHQIYLTDFPFIVLYGESNFGLARKGTHNYQISPFEGETVNIWEWWCDNGKC